MVRKYERNEKGKEYFIMHSKTHSSIEFPLHYHTDFLFKMVIKLDEQRYEDLHENRQAPQRLSTILVI